MMKLQRWGTRKLMEVSQNAFDNQDRVHQLKCWPNYFQEIWAREKTFEIRITEDRDFRVGDTLWLEEVFSKTEFTGRVITAEVTSKLENFSGIKPGFCIMSIKVLDTFDPKDYPDDGKNR